MLLQLHGNAMTAQQAASWFAPLIAEGYGMIFAEYCGYSGNPGSPSEAGAALDAAAWSDLAFARADHVMPARPVYYVAHSLGGGVAFQAAGHNVPTALVTIGAFADTPSPAPMGIAALIADGMIIARASRGCTVLIISSTAAPIRSSRLPMRLCCSTRRELRMSMAHASCWPTKGIIPTLAKSHKL